MYDDLTLDDLRRHRPDLVDALFGEIEEAHQECRSLPQVLVTGTFVRQLLECNSDRERKRLVANRHRLLNGRDAPRQMDFDEVLGVGTAAAAADRDRARSEMAELLAV